VRAHPWPPTPAVDARHSKAHKEPMVTLPPASTPGAIPSGCYPSAPATQLASAVPATPQPMRAANPQPLCPPRRACLQAVHPNADVSATRCSSHDSCSAPLPLPATPQARIATLLKQAPAQAASHRAPAPLLGHPPPGTDVAEAADVLSSVAGPPRAVIELLPDDADAKLQPAAEACRGWRGMLHSHPTCWP
jgi:hypothetical protein